MSIVIEFFVAPDAEAAAAVAEGRPTGFFESLTFGNVDVEKALTGWEGIFTGRSFEEVLDDDIPETVVDPDDGEVSDPEIAVWILSGSGLTQYARAVSSRGGMVAKGVLTLLDPLETVQQAGAFVLHEAGAFTGLAIEAPDSQLSSCASRPVVLPELTPSQLSSLIDLERTISGYLRLGGRTRSGQTLVQVLGESLPHCGCPPVALAWLSHGMRLAEHRARSG